MAKRRKSAKAAGPKLHRILWRDGRTHGAARAVSRVPRQPDAARGRDDQRRDASLDLKKAKIVTVKTVVNVVYNTDRAEHLDAQINSQITAMNKDFRATNPDKSKTPAPWKGLVTDARIQFKLVKVTRTKTAADRLHLRRRGEEGVDRRHRARSPRRRT